MKLLLIIPIFFSLSTLALLNTSSWKKKELDQSRGQCIFDSPTKECNETSDKNGKNCWRCDDEDRDKLNMNRNHLNHVTEINANTGELRDGHYIYVLSGNGKLFIRNYDRSEGKGPHCKKYYEKFRYSQNDRNGNYLHVRHSQLNNGWEPVFGAGEMKILNGEVKLVNNESGHFKPQDKSVEYVVQVLNHFAIKMVKDFKAGNFGKIKAELSEQECALLHKNSH